MDSSTQFPWDFTSSIKFPPDAGTSQPSHLPSTSSNASQETSALAASTTAKEPSNAAPVISDASTENVPSNASGSISQPVMENTSTTHGAHETLPVGSLAAQEDGQQTSTTNQTSRLLTSVGDPVSKNENITIPATDSSASPPPVDPSQAKLNNDLISAAANGSLGRVKDFLNRGAEIGHQAADNATALVLACRTGQVDMAGALLNHKEGAKIINVADRHGCTPLYWACEKGMTKTVQRLLELEADMDVVSNDKRTALHAACKHANIETEIARMLIEKGASMEKLDEDGRTPLQ
jgi:hypothetical protein